jgi:hypothetical protein
MSLNPYARIRAWLRPGRQELASSLRRIARDEVPAAAFGTRLAAPRPQVDGARADLERLADSLAAPGPVDPRGVSLARDLLSDGASPLLWRGSEEDLGERAREALAALGAVAS